MPKDPTKPTLQKIQTESDDELDDLDDVLDKFTPAKPIPSAPPPSATASTSSTTFGNRPRHNTRVDAPPISIPGTGPKLATTTEEETLDEDQLQDDFSRELAKGMEELMKEITNGLATGDKTTISGGSGSGGGGGVGDGGDERMTDEERAIKAAWEAMLVEGLNGGGGAGAEKDWEALGEILGKDGVKPRSDVTGTSGVGAAPTNDFQARIKQAMDKIKASESNLQSETNSSTPGSTNPESLEGLLKSIGDLGIGEGGDEQAELAGFLENMMGQLMSKEVLYEPLKELFDNFPGYLANPPKELDPADKIRYEKQYTYLKQIIELFEKPGYSDTDPEANKTVMTLMSEMQAHGSPPAEIMGPLPPGFENGFPQSGDDNCVTS